MTVINGINLVNGANQPFNGVLTIQAVEPIFLDDTQVVRQIGSINIVNGTFSLGMVPSENKLYEFIINEIVVNPGSPDETPPIPPFDEQIEVDRFRASVPDSSTPITFSSLFEQTGISAGSFDASLLSITRRLYTDDNFWSKLDDNILPAKGVFSYGNYYQNGDIVFEDGSSYRCISKVPVVGVYVDDVSTWVPFATRGNTGTGVTGNSTAYGMSWDGATDAPSRDAIHNLVEDLPDILDLDSYAKQASPVLDGPTLLNTPSSTSNSKSVASTDFVQALVQGIRKAICPVGTIVDYAGTSAPAGWVFCDGRALSKTGYSELYQVLGDIYGSQSSTFNVPDTRGRSTLAPDSSVLMGASGTTPGVAVGDSVGNHEKTLSIGEMPTHTHDIAATLSDPIGVTPAAGSVALNLSLKFADGGSKVKPLSSGTPDVNSNPPAHTTPVAVAFQGSGESFSLLQPNLVVNKIIYTGN